VSVASNVWITAGATVAGGTQIGENFFIGANATIGSGLVIGNNVFIGAGALVTQDVPDNSVLIQKGTALCNIHSEKFIQFLDLKGNY
jgi:acetyltransferase-like isoleucine patch superfamily enzyme